MTQDKQFVLDTMRAQGLAQAQALQEASPEMTGTELYAQEGYIPDFQAAKAAKNMLERNAGQTDGFVCRATAGRVVRLIQPYDSTIYTQEPEELPAQWGFAWSTDPAKALLVSPVLDMERLIRSMMQWAGVTEELLQEQGEIHTSFGQTLSWRYLRWVREHPVSRWDCPIHILYANRDNMTSRATVEAYARRSHAQLTVVNGEHWFHTPEQLASLQNWEERAT